MKKTFFRILKITGLSIVSVLLLLFFLPYFFPKSVSEKIKQLTNQHLKSELNFKHARLSFFNHFPTLTLTLYDFTLKGSAPFEKDTLIASKEVALGVDLGALLSGKINVNKIFLTDALINVEVTEKGEANYNVYKTSENVSENKTDTSGGASLNIEKILIEKSTVKYDDRSLPMVFSARGFNYSGKGDLSKSVFELTTHAEIDSLDFNYDHETYFVSKKIRADLITKINTNSLSFLFEKNDLHINQLPVEFTGKFEFLKNGYAMDFNVNSNATDLRNVITVMPPEYLKWLEKTKVEGAADIGLRLSGKYIAETKTKPGLSMNMGVRQGYISYENAPDPVTNLFLNFEAKLPGLNPDSLYVNVDSAFFNIEKDYFSSVIRVKGLREQNIHARINSEIDLEKWNRAFGLKIFDIKGRYSLHLAADGLFSKIQNPISIHPDTIINSIPAFKITSSLKDGYFKYASVKQPVKNIHFDLNAECTDYNYKHTSLSAENINADFLNDYIRGFLKIKGGNDPEVNAALKSLFHLSSVKQIYPVEGLNLEGVINLDIVSKGKFNAANKLFPVTTAAIKMEQGSIQTKYYPHPVEEIKIDAELTNTDGTLRTTHVNLNPVAFKFEGEPFAMKFDLDNFENLKYDINSTGTLNIGNIYRVFSRKGLDVKGLIKTDLRLRGLQSDAASGHYGRLFNEGRMEVKDMQVNSEYFPLPFYIKNGIFTFKQDKIWLEAFTAFYGNSDFILNGYLSNTLNYYLKNEPLTGNFKLRSNFIDVNQFMAYAGDTTKSSETGVIIIPSNLNINFTADIKKVRYSEVTVTDAGGAMSLQNGKLSLKQTGFTIIGAPVVMDANYSSITPKKAVFDYHIDAKDFDIKRAYHEIKIFHDLASAAASAQGIVSLDYNLKGKLDSNMHPVFPSLEGGGTLSVKKVKMKGFKLFSAVGRQTGRDSLSNPDLSKVDIKTTIKNNIITFKSVKMRVAGFRPKFQGQASLDGKLNLKFRLGLPPLGIFGIPMRITGTEDKPIIKFRRGSDNQPLQETSDPDND